MKRSNTAGNNGGSIEFGVTNKSQRRLSVLVRNSTHMDDAVNGGGEISER